MTSVYDLPEWAAWVAAIRACPEDDTVRLVAADWLEERGEGERAEWIRVQVELSRLRSASWHDEWKAGRLVTQDPVREHGEKIHTLKTREKELWHKWSRCWTPADERAGLNTYGDRGFVARVSGPLASLHGGGCGRCRGERVIYDPADFRRTVASCCPTCHGAGRTVGVLGAILRREPVTADGIEVTDFEPILINGGSWSLSQWRLPESQTELAALLPYETFPTHDAARLALNRALFALHAPTGAE